MEGEWRSDHLSAVLLAFGKGRAVKCMNLIHLDDIGISSFLEIQQKKKKSMIVWEDGSHLACWSIQTYQHFVPKGLTAPTSRFWVCFYSSGFYYNHNIWPNTYSVLFIFKLVMQIQGRMKRSCEALFLLPAGHFPPSQMLAVIGNLPLVLQSQGSAPTCLFSLEMKQPLCMKQGLNVTSKIIEGHLFLSFSLI